MTFEHARTVQEAFFKRGKFYIIKTQNQEKEEYTIEEQNLALVEAQRRAFQRMESFQAVPTNMVNLAEYRNRRKTVGV